MRRLREIIDVLLDGWNERIEYSVRVQVHDAACQEIQLDMTVPQLRHMTCVCPEVLEKRSEKRKQPPLLTQLIEAQYSVPVGGDSSGGSGAANKPKSKPPGNLLRPDEFISMIHDAAMEHVSNAGIFLTVPRKGMFIRLECALIALRDHTLDDFTDRAATQDFSTLVHRARVMLGYESETVLFESSVCGTCGGGLKISRDAPSAVVCAGTPSTRPCGTTYPWQVWGQLLAERQTLVDTADAVAATGIPAGTIRRWASEGRIVKYGGSGRGESRWDLGELTNVRAALDKAANVPNT